MHWPASAEPGYTPEEVVWGKDRGELLANLRGLVQPNLPAVAGCFQADGDSPLVPSAPELSLFMLAGHSSRMTMRERVALRDMGVRFVICRLPAPGLGTPVFRGETNIYELSSPRPGAWVEPRMAGILKAVMTCAGRWAIEASIARPASVIINETFVPGWKALRDGDRMRVTPTADGRIAIPVSAGVSRLSLRYDPFAPRFGLLIGTAMAAFLLVLGGV